MSQEIDETIFGPGHFPDGFFTKEVTQNGYWSRQLTERSKRAVREYKRRRLFAADESGIAAASGTTQDGAPAGGSRLALYSTEMFPGFSRGARRLSQYSETPQLQREDPVSQT